MKGRSVLEMEWLVLRCVAGTAEVMRFLAEEISPDTYVNIMGQYRPAGKVGGGSYREIQRRVSGEEMRAAYKAAKDAGLWRLDR
jgi:putative pyruvate formate lyase activating enzyme